MKVKVLAIMALLTMGFMVGCDITITDTTPPNPDTIVLDFGGTGAGVFCFSNSTSQYTLKTFFMDTVFGEWNDKGFTNVDIAAGKTAMIINLDAGTYHFFLQLHNNSYNFDFAMSNNINTTIVMSNTNYASIEPAWLGITNDSCYTVNSFCIWDKSTFDLCSILPELAGDNKVNAIDPAVSHSDTPWFEMFPSEIPAGIYTVNYTNTLTKSNMTVSGVDIQGHVTNVYTVKSSYGVSDVWLWQ